MISKENLDEMIEDIWECENCQDIQIKKFSPIKDWSGFESVDDNFKRCSCGKRPIDVVMAHILKIMIEEETVPQNATLRRNSPVPLSNFYYSSLNPQFIKKGSLILLHPDFTEEVASRLIGEVSEVACILKGSPQDTAGMLDKDSNINHFEILEGDDTQINVMRTLIGDRITLVKNQARHHIEVAMTTEQKLVQLHNYLNNNDIKKGVAIDAMCGLGALGIYMLKCGFEKVIFNDINPEMIGALKVNLEINGITDNFEIFNESFEDLKIDESDFCVIDAFPSADTSKIKEKAEKIADNVLII
ncbi:SAM-dependent methyltransferase [Methanobrevibacter sp.]|uniref:SAM-dependent methyltransferase n=1 Tax=Methanobrevibacter sp. TaxID=66852 RepID=UPI0026E0C27F|nr:SAM-dependent methyltransferase [Methanobrevibacter sp.]MDO5859969.1 SAM-dependent methyltransferase [Methanobrevibacter sp.]